MGACSEPHPCNLCSWYRRSRPVSNHYGAPRCFRRPSAGLPRRPSTYVVGAWTVDSVSQFCYVFPSAHAKNLSLLHGITIAFHIFPIIFLVLRSGTLALLSATKFFF